MPNHNKSEETSSFSRRKFLGSAAAISAFSIVPRRVLGGPGQTPPSEQIRLAGVGAGGNMCRNDLQTFVGIGAQIAAVADPWDFDGWQPAAQEAYRKSYPQAKIYRDYRELLENEPDVDGVVVETPDHWHAKVTMDAMRLGKHVYTQKPLTRTISEARALVRVAAETGLATSMGNQGHSGEWIRRVCEIIWDGDVIGPVHEVHAWSDRAGLFWQQGVPRPAEAPSVPKNFDWDLWLGPAPARPYHPVYMPIAWRGWCDFGAGALGDMGCHILDSVYWALKLGQPISVEATSTLELPTTVGETFPKASLITYHFPARGEMPPVKVMWYDGGLQPPLPEGFARGRKLATNGAFFIGESGTMYNTTFENPEILGVAGSGNQAMPRQVIERSPGHYHEWIAKCQGKNIACAADFQYSAGLTEMVLLGTIAARVNERLEWDGPGMKIRNNDLADQMVHHRYRDGWTL